MTNGCEFPDSSSDDMGEVVSVMPFEVKIEHLFSSNFKLFVYLKEKLHFYSLPCTSDSNRKSEILAKLGQI